MGAKYVRDEERARIRELRYGDGMSCPAVARIVGRCVTTVRFYAPGRPGKVSNDLLRDAFLRSGLTAAEVARRAGWWERGSSDSSRVKRTLGLIDCVSGHRGGDGERIRTRRMMIDFETAETLADAVGVGVWEVIPDDLDEAA